MAKKIYTLQKHADGERPGVMWAWTDRLSAEDIIYQIHKFKEAGIEEFYIHPSWTLECDDYLSDFFMEMIKVACDTAEGLGMKYSLYDEYDWASGTCAGKVIEKYPEMRMTMLRWYHLDAPAGEPLEIWFKGQVLAVQVQYSDKQKYREDITEKVRMETFADGAGGRILWDNISCCTASVWVFCRVYPEWIGATGKWASFTNNTRGFTDTMNKDAVRKFLEMNNDVYKQKIGDRFGSTVKRLFTDETSMACVCDMPLSEVKPYSVVLEEEFEKEHGYRIRDHFIALTSAYDTDEDIKVRYAYHKTCTRLFTTAYLDQVADWCHANGLKLTGHMSGEGVLYYHTMQMGDFYEALSRFDIPGVDNILSKKYMDVPTFAYETKMLASVAKFNGKDNTMCETFSGSGWDLSLEEMKRIMNRLMSLGVSYIIYMTAFYSMSEGRKDFPIGYPPSHGYNNPLFRHYSTLTDYVAVRASLMTKTKPMGSSLVLIPQADAWTHHPTEALHTSRLNLDWQHSTLQLQNANVEHDILFEPLAKEVEVKDGRLYLRGYSYDTLVLPYVRCSTQATLDMVAEFAAQGGRLVFVDSLPYLAADTGKKYDFIAACGLSGECGSFFKNLEGAYGIRQEGNTLLINTGMTVTFPAGQFREDLSQFVKDGSREEAVEAVSVPLGVHLARRSAEGLYCCFIDNDTDKAQTVTLKINSEDKLTLLDGVKLCDCEVKEGLVTLTIAPHDMPALILTAQGVTVDGLEIGEAVNAAEYVGCAAACSTVQTEGAQQITLKNGWNFKTDKYNMLPLKMKYLAKKEPNGALSEDIRTLADLMKVPKYASQEFPAGQGLKYGSGYAAFAKFEIKDMPEYLEIFNEVVDDGELWLNGKRLTGFTKVKEWGVRDSVTDITAHVKVGSNVLIMINRVPYWKGPHQMPSCVVRGDFCVENGVIVSVKDSIEPDIFTKYGWRYYSGDASYYNSFVLEKEPARVKLTLDTKDVAEVIVNGISAGTYYWQPYEADITALCHAGENTLEIKVTSNMSPTMVVEEVVLIRQGVMEYRDEAPAQIAGILSAPLLTVRYK